MNIGALFLAVAMMPAGGWNVTVEADGQNGMFTIEPPPLIEVKGDNMIDDPVVRAKQIAAEEMATASEMHYLMYAGSRPHRILCLIAFLYSYRLGQ